MNKNKVFPSLVCGFGAAVLTIIPGYNEAKGSITCCLFVPLASIFSLMLYQRTNHEELPFKVSRAMFVGLLSGVFLALFSTFFETIITLITHTNDFVNALPETESVMRGLNMGPMYTEAIKILKNVSRDISLHGFSLFYTTGMLFGNLIINSVVGVIGGLLGLLIINRKPKQ
jgi:hypothetical protein